MTGASVGIDARNNGTGALSVTASGFVEGTGLVGIRANNSAAGTSLTVSAAAVTGGDDGIEALNYGKGAVLITASGFVEGKGTQDAMGFGGDGIFAYNSNTGTSLTISAAAVKGGEDGIDARNLGDGVLSITATGTVTGTAGDGIHADNVYELNGYSGKGTDLTIIAAAVMGGDIGIYAHNRGAGGALSITASGLVEGTAGDGIYAYNSGRGTGLTVIAAAVKGGEDGIEARNNGTGDLTITAATVTGGTNGIYAYNYGRKGYDALSITTTGDVIGGTGDGIHAKLSSDGVNYGTNLTISAAAVMGGDDGIDARNYGKGALSITATGTVTGTAGDGIYGYNSNAGTDLTVTAAAVTGGADGIDARNLGDGALSITASGTVIGARDGIHADNVNQLLNQNYGYGTDLTIIAAAVTGGDNGIYAQNRGYGTGALSITASGLVEGTAGDGIYAYNSGRGTGLTITAAAVMGGEDGIEARNNGSTYLTVTAAAVTGDDTGIYARNNGTGALSVTASGAVEGMAYDGIFVNNAGTNLTVSAAAVTGYNRGIYARNTGTGAVSVTASGLVDGMVGDGIFAYNSTQGTGLTVTAAAVKGGDDGIIARNFGSTYLTVTAAAVTGGSTGINAFNAGTGALSVTATGAVEGENYNGINAFNSAGGTDLTVSTAAVTGGYSGIFAYNAGTGVLSVTAGGDVEGEFVDGIFAYNSGTDLTVTAATVTGFNNGINARNTGTGALSITATGAVEGENYNGIYANNSTAGTGLTISAAALMGDLYGIFARNLGTGALSITASGFVEGTAGDGIYAHNSGNGPGTGLTITAAAVKGGADGIDARNYGSTYLTVSAAAVTGGSHGINALNTGIGVLSITATGAVAGEMRDGIFARNLGANLTISAAAVTGGEDGIDARNTGTDLTITAAAVMGGEDGIFAQNVGTGALSITATGDVVGTNYDGINARNDGTNLTISAAAVTGDRFGILAQNVATGALSVTATGAVIGTNYDGIFAAANTGTDLTISATAVTGGRYGILTRNYGTGVLSVTTNGVVTGGTGVGISTQGNAGGLATITLNNGSTVSATSGNAISNDDMNSMTTVNAGAAVNGTISLGDGSDDLLFAGGDASGVTLFDGGDDSSTADGFIDTLGFTSGTFALAGANVVNWELFNVNAGATVSLADGAMAIGDGAADTGFRVNAGGTFMLANGNNLTGALTNAGIMSLQNGAAGDRVTLTGNYTGDSGSLLIDVVLGDDTSLADVFVITGNTTGTTTIAVNNIGGLGGEAENGIEVVDVQGTSDGIFTLAGTLAAGGFVYTLVQQADGDWALTSMVSDATIYEALPSYLLSLNKLRGYSARIGNRHDAQGPTIAASTKGNGITASTKAGGNGYEPVSPLWVAIEGSRSKLAPVASDAGVAKVDIDAYKIYMGADVTLTEGATGNLYGGLTAFYGNASGNVSTTTGSGSFDTDSFGLELSTTWVADSGFYLDGQVQYTFTSSDLTGMSVGSLVEGNKANGFATSVELGKAFVVAPGLNITPQAQLTYSTYDVDDYHR